MKKVICIKNFMHFKSGFCYSHININDGVYTISVYYGKRINGSLGRSFTLDYFYKFFKSITEYRNYKIEQILK